MATQEDFAWPGVGPVTDESFEELTCRSGGDQRRERNDSGLCARQGGRVAFVFAPSPLVRRKEFSAGTRKIDPTAADKAGLPRRQDRNPAVDSG
jgi:hypothetical protein